MKSGSLSRSPLSGSRRGSFIVALALVALGALALAGPYGLLAWSESKAVLQQREARIAKLEEERAELANLVERLDPAATDPDLVTELIRRDLNVAHPDEYVMEVAPPVQ